MWAMRLIMDGLKDHLVPHISGKKMTNEMWKILKTMYQGSSIERNMLLENQMRLFQMQKGEEIDPFLFRLHTIQDQLIAMGITPDEGILVSTALNAVTNEWETFVQSILGREALPSWANMWEILCQEEIKRFTRGQSSSGGLKVEKEDDEYVALASKG